MNGTLVDLGWDDARELAFAPERERGLEPGRVIAQHRGGWVTRTADAETVASVGGRLRHESLVASDLPAVGDWVGLKGAQIQSVLPRRQSLIRKASGQKVAEQVLAANIDTVVVVTSVNREFNLRRIERYVLIAWESGATPLVVLSKADLVDDAELATARAGVESVAPGVPVLAVSARSGLGLEDLRSHLAPQPGRTAAFVGSSGVGKSTLVNTLAGEELIQTAEIRGDDDRGRHTTTIRQLHVLPGGWLLLDTPGIREVGIWATADDVERAFGDILDLADTCRFRDCRHENEPGCAVRAAVADGRLPQARFDLHRKLEREAAHLARTGDPRAQAAEKRRWRMINKSVGQHMVRKYGADR